jgi:putative ABC transport system substrate-binding protein
MGSTSPGVRGATVMGVGIRKPSPKQTCGHSPRNVLRYRPWNQREYIPMKRRDFIAAAGLTVMWPSSVLGAEPLGMRRICLLLNFSADEAEGHVRETTLVQELKKLGWIEGSNVQIDPRWAADDADLYRRYSKEIIALAPDVIVAFASPSVAALRRITHSIPIVFANVIDPVGAGFVASLARPSGNTTGFSAFEYSISGKWLEVLKELAPNLTRVAVLRDASLAAGIGQFAAIEALAPSSLGLELTPIDMRDVGEIEQALSDFASEPNGGLIVTASPLAVTHRDAIISLATRYRLPNVYPFRYYPASGGLASYGPDPNDDYTRAAVYVDRILKGEKPANLPVQLPTRYEFVVNLKAAKVLGLDIASPALTRADELIE